ncbi:MAG: efflux RND transporter periplasmic adaptor subunit [Patescibacteria group bacterium]|nr:efflux RND transporter periplasmic adaptor subunit [Patescibacteria group bacterium]
MLKKYGKFIVIGLIVIALVVIALSVLSKANNNKKIKTVTVKRGDLHKTLTISGEINAEEKVTLRFQAGGRLSWVGVKEGDYVQKYQGIASLDQRQLQKTLEKYLNDYKKYRDDYDQTTQDEYRFVALDNEIKRIMEKSQADLNKTVLDVELQTIAKEYSYLWTPIEGIVTKVTSPYAGVNIYLPTQAEFEIINPKSVYFSALVDQTDIRDLHEGMSGDLTLDSYTESTISGVVNNIAFTPKAGETGTVYEIKFNFTEDNSSYKYKVGMAGDLTMILQSRTNVLYLPVAAIKDDAGRKYVNVMKNGKTEKIYIETGLETDDSTEILSGLTENQAVYD